MTTKLFSIQKLYESMKQKKQGERQRTQTGTEEAIFFFNFPVGVTESLNLQTSSICEDLIYQIKENRQMEIS